MHNPNHSLMYHNQHSTTITGFTWYDENTVWSVGTREQLIQCDMQSDAILTSGLLPNTVADFSPNTRICVATGEHESRHGRALDWTTSQRFYASDPWPAPGTVAAAGPDSIRPASNSSSDPRRAAGADLFRPKLPCPFVDEHVLDESVLIRANVIKHLARNYRYDPDNLGECCENNARAALTARLPDMAKFWLVLSTVFGDARPLKPKRRPKAPRGRGQRSADQNNQESQLTVVATNSASVAQSAATSRSSSGVFASKSVTSIVQGSGSDDDDDEPAARDPARRRLVPTARSLAATSPADIRQSLSACSLGIASDGLVPHVRPGRPRYPAGTGPLDRGFMSLSHSNLQQAGAARSRSRVPSPLSRPATKAGAGPSGGCASEPATPAHHRLGQRTFQCPPAGPGAALGTAHRRAHLLGADHSAAATQNGAPPPHTSGLPHRSLLHADAAPPAGKEGVPVAMPCAERPMFALRTAADAAAAAETAGVEAAAEQARLGVESQRRVSRADLQLAVESCAYYANKGDVQTALTAALLLRRFIRISEWRAIKGWFIDYIDQLDQHQEHAVATDIILACPFPDVPDQLNDRVTIALSCIICGVKLDYHPDAGFAWCNECKHAANSCVVCQMP
ncbi:SEA (Seh1-associated) complex subunit, partial [Coemansia helicoidea]